MKRDEGSLLPLVIGLVLVLLTLFAVGVDVTSLHLARIRVWDAADAAARDAADSLAEDRLYRGGLGDTLPVDRALVVEEARAHLAATPLPRGVATWAIDSPTGATPTGVEVTVTARVRLPVRATVLSRFGDSVVISVTVDAASYIQR